MAAASRRHKRLSASVAMSRRLLPVRTNTAWDAASGKCFPWIGICFALPRTGKIQWVHKCLYSCIQHVQQVFTCYISWTSEYIAFMPRLYHITLLCANAAHANTARPGRLTNAAGQEVDSSRPGFSRAIDSRNAEHHLAALAAECDELHEPLKRRLVTCPDQGYQYRPRNQDHKKNCPHGIAHNRTRCDPPDEGHDQRNKRSLDEVSRPDSPAENAPAVRDISRNDIYLSLVILTLHRNIAQGYLQIYSQEELRHLPLSCFSPHVIYALIILYSQCFCKLANSKRQLAKGTRAINAQVPFASRVKVSCTMMQ